MAQFDSIVHATWDGQFNNSSRFLARTSPRVKIYGTETCSRIRFESYNY